jgi:dihydroxy-acid dehydratase
LAVLRTGDRVRVDLRKRQVNVMLSDAEMTKRGEELANSGGYKYPESQTPWQDMQRAAIGQFAGGAVLESALRYQKIAQRKGIPRHNH